MAACLVACAAGYVGAQTCTVTYTNLNFGTYTGTVVNNTNSATIKCNGGTWTLGLNAGTGSGATITDRKLTGPGGAQLNYTLFQDAARTTVWGDTATTEESGSGNTTQTIYGQVFAGQFAVPGTYTDTVSSVTSSFTVTATVQATCSISATSLAFGTYASVAINSTSTLSVTCTNTTPYNVGLNAGTASGATVTNRSMTGPGAAKLGYKLFRDSGRTLNWGNTVGTDTLAGTGTGALQSLTVYGQLTAGQHVAPGSYADTITATLTY
ncbi:MAG TPA: spore coat protein U domain-containing protein [Terracidiphilus sp.]|jgi:spore coat protein U-like protein